MEPREPPGPESADPSSEKLLQVLQEVAARRRSGEELSDEAVCAAHPELMPGLAEHLKYLGMAGEARAPSELTLEQEPEPPPGLPTDSFAGYRILREIHRGGQGVVYQAIQMGTKRKVAIKVMKEGPFAGRSDKARFEREVEILGRLQHPHIVAIHDSGEVSGNHYFVMDYVPGQSLDAWMASGQRSVEETLRLFAKICEAVNAAHLRGIIHRDLKPGNIRIDAENEPRVLDFGLAKVATGAEASLMTVTGQFVGSLPWASPEQAEGDPHKIDVRTDVYSLGVILYQMLTGRFPYEVVGNMRDVLDRIIKNEPARPSTVRKQINDEVETIVLKCLSKERERRYQTAGELGRDVQCYLQGEPIEAKRDSAVYVLRKYLRKYRLPAALAAGFVLVVTAGLVASLTFWRQAAVARGRAEERRIAAEASEANARDEAEKARSERDKAERIAQFMGRTLSGVGPSVALGRDTTMLREMMDRAAQRIEEGELRDSPRAELKLRLTIGDTYRQLAAYDKAENILGPTLALAHNLKPSDPAAVAGALHSLGLLSLDRAEFPEAKRLLREELEVNRQRGNDANVVGSLINLSIVLKARGDLAEVEQLLNEALAINQRLHKTDDPSTATVLDSLAGLQFQSGNWSKAEELYRRALEMCERMYHGDHPDVSSALNNLGSVLSARGDAQSAETCFRRALEMDQRLHPGVHPDVARRMLNLGVAQHSQGKLAEAEQNLRKALGMFREFYPKGHPDTAATLIELQAVLHAQGETAACEPLLREALEVWGKVLPPDHWSIGNAYIGLGGCLAEQNRFAEAEPVMLKADAILRAARGAPPDRLPGNMGNLIELYDLWDRADPGHGHDKQAAEWRAKLAKWRASTQPAATRPSSAPTSAPAGTAARDNLHPSPI